MAHGIPIVGTKPGTDRFHIGLRHGDAGSSDQARIDRLDGKGAGGCAVEYPPFHSLTPRRPISIGTKLDAEIALEQAEGRFVSRGATFAGRYPSISSYPAGSPGF